MRDALRKTIQEVATPKQGVSTGYSCGRAGCGGTIMEHTETSLPITEQESELLSNFQRMLMHSAPRSYRCDRCMRTVDRGEIESIRSRHAPVWPYART